MTHINNLVALVTSDDEDRFGQLARVSGIDTEGGYVNVQFADGGSERYYNVGESPVAQFYRHNDETGKGFDQKDPPIGPEGLLTQFVMLGQDLDSLKQAYRELFDEEFEYQ